MSPVAAVEPDDDDLVLAESSHELADEILGSSRRGRSRTSPEEARASLAVYEAAKAEHAALKAWVAGGKRGKTPKSPNLDELHRRYEVKMAKQRGERITDAQFEEPVRMEPKLPVEQCQMCGEDIVLHKGVLPFLHVKVTLDDDHGAVASASAKRRLTKRGSQPAPAPARPEAASPTPRSKPVASEQTGNSKRRVLRCGHTKLWTKAKWVDNPICEECPGRPTRGVVRLEEQQGKDWKAIDPPKGAKLVDPEGTAPAMKKAARSAAPAKSTAKKAPAKKAAKSTAKKATAKKAGGASAPLAKLAPVNPGRKGTPERIVGARKTAKRVTRKA